MGQKVSKIPIIPYLKGILFFAITQPFFDPIDWNRSSRDYYLSIGVNKTRFWALFAISDFWALKKSVLSKQYV